MHYHGKVHFLDKWERRIFLDVHMHVITVKIIILHWVSDCSLKTQNKWYSGNHIIHTALLFFHEVLPLWLAVEIHLCQSTAFYIEHCHKRSFFFLSLVMMFLRKESFLCLERRLVTIDMWYSLFFSLSVWRNQMPSLLTFPIFIKWQQIVD